jgi:hypothetical protein
MLERGHLAAGDDTAGTVHIVDRRVAALAELVTRIAAKQETGNCDTAGVSQSR